MAKSAAAEQKSGAMRGLGIREKNRQETQARLIVAAMRLLSERGYESVTVDDIAGDAGVSRRTLFRYFPGKDEIVLAWTQGMTGVLAETIRATPSSIDAREAMIRSFEAVIPRMASSRREAFAFVSLIEKTPALLPVSLRKYAQWEDSLAEALQLRLEGTEEERRLGSRVMARSGIAAFRTALDEWLTLRGRPVLDDVLRRTFHLQSRTLCAQHAMCEEEPIKSKAA
ncbi:MAG: TetR family transcriptional regulator [Acetobacter sp.]|nr:TetR family transcriptional regulator [Acetobacter sp.]MCH4060949.1 TetR family transcriptional regulator [Acetobacter sp.]MCH4087889.1 TetR family transcriptional regulator [Acetobacter sp.]MCI1293495.1 TetR family transcriptional regulator [Acetobacter sp.]MCI1319779.1 TetR family transcriptional regulator [Acetobacter sp.]